MRSSDRNNSSIDLGSELSDRLTIHKNVNQEIILTTSDKLKLVLIETKASLTAKRDWVTPFGLMVSFIATLCTAEFKTAFGLNAEFWHAFFLLLVIASFIWLVVAVIKLISNWKSDDVHKIIDRIKPLSQVEVEEPETERRQFMAHATLSKSKGVDHG
jgi:hypothetical protein